MSDSKLPSSGLVPLKKSPQKRKLNIPDPTEQQIVIKAGELAHPELASSNMNIPNMSLAAMRPTMKMGPSSRIRKRKLATSKYTQSSLSAERMRQPTIGFTESRAEPCVSERVSTTALADPETALSKGRLVNCL